MSINFHPNPGTMLVCDFHGMTAPEIVKTRPIIVISPRLRRGNGLCTVVPLSTTPPKFVMPWHCRLMFEGPLAPNWRECIMWAKCDLLYSMRFERLDRFYQVTDNKRKYYDRRVNEEDWGLIRKAVFSFLGEACI